MSPEGQDTPRKRRRSPARLMIIVGSILAVEAVVIIGAMMLLGGPPKVEAAEVAAVLEAPEEERIVEILVLDGKLPNNKSGATYLYDTEIYVQVKKRYADEVAEELSQFRNEIKSEITAVWRTAEARHFQEPRLQSLTRRIQTMLSDRFGVDQQRDEPIISKCVIVMGMGFRIDS
jgi:ABC-type glycerol-3-phosphate transport system substrate-binding protein